MPWFASFGFTLALAARAIVVLIGYLFNRLALDVGVSPLIKLDSIKRYALFPDGEFTHIRPDRFVEFIPAHAEIAGGIHKSDESRRDAADLGRGCVRHGESSPPFTGRLMV
ncbi:hypothetical protein J2X84_002352 [Pseudomonas corrugata]|nr:hypothetical protein [Pseudomonas corrugata]